MPNLSLSLDLVRSTLLQLQAAGDAGFEGLVANQIAAKAGLQIRLAKSGSQFGRDASSPRDAFAIAVEAKRYDANLRLDDLLGKAASAGFALGADTDLWVVCATTEIGDDIVRKVTTVVEQSGMTVLFLDWSPAPLPPLAVLLASASESVITWFAKHNPATNRESLQAALSAVRSSDLFASSEKLLLASLSSSGVGLDALRKKNRSWLEERWSNALLSRQEFGQVVTPLAGKMGILDGRAVRLGLEVQVTTKNEPTVVAILGEEGVGKTWLITDWWLNSLDAPVLVPVLGRAVDSLDPRDPFGSLAKVLAQRHRDTQIDPLGWERRLHRWSKRSKTSKPWCVVVLDGLNERPDLPWADTIVAFALALTEAGILLMVTCRPAFWKREVVHRLRQELVVEELHVPEYTDPEVKQILSNFGVNPNGLSEQLTAFLRNPRVCTVALTLLGELNATAAELTIERLQLEYWKHRLNERGDLLIHNAEEFHKVLRAHAKEWLVDPAQQFDIDNLSTKSTLVKRKPNAVERDLSDIVEGRFMTVSEGDGNSYEFRPEALPFAIGLLLAHEIRSLRNPTKELYEATIDALVEPVRAFDLTSQIVGAAFGLACVDTACLTEGSRALLTVWASLQNLDQKAIDRMSPNVLIRCDVFCDVLERMHQDVDHHAHLEELERIVFKQTRHPHVRSVLKQRISQWLGRWCRKAIPFPRDKRPNLERQSVEDDLAKLSPEERDVFADLCSEVADPRSTDLDELAVFLMSAMPQADFAAAVWGWCLAQTIAGDHTNAQEDLAWVVRLNRCDWSATANAVRSVIAEVDEKSSELYRRAAARLLRLLGDLNSEARADTLVGPVRKREGWRRVEQFCNTNPHDPDAPICTNLSRSIETVESIPIEMLRTSRSQNIEDHNWATAIPPLARFAIEPLVDAVRRFVMSIEVREGMALLALSWDLPEFSPLLDQVSVSAIERTLDRFVATEVDWKDGDNQLIVNDALRAILPHFSALPQAELLMRLPAGVQMFLDLEGTFKPIDAKLLETSLKEAAASPNESALERVLFLASAHPATFNSETRDVVRSLITGSSTRARNVAFDVVRRAGDTLLDAEVLSGWEESPSSGEDFYREEAVARAVVRSGRADLLRLVMSDLRQAVASQMGDDAIRVIADGLEASIERLLKPILSAEGQDLMIEVEATSDGLMQRVDVSQRKDEEFGLELLGGDPNVLAREHTERGRQARKARKTLTEHPAKEGAEVLLAVPYRGCIERVVATSPERCILWLGRILAEPNKAILRQVFNLGVVLAGAFAKIDGALSARVLIHLRDLQSLQAISWGTEHIPIYPAAVFAESDSSEMILLRRWIVMNATNDGHLETYARAASLGCKEWLRGFIHEHHLDENPDVQARALVLAGFCFPEDDLDYVFVHDRLTGFLGDVHKYAAKQRARATWAKHWCASALAAETSIDFWRFGKLAEGVVDARFVRAFDDLADDYPHAAFISELHVRLDKAAKDRGKKRKDTLCGLKVPSDPIVWAMRTLSEDR